MKPRLLDLFCGAGGAGMGYHRAGFEVVGVDLHPQQHYPFEFHQADALTFPLGDFDAIHASPPCQAYSEIQRITQNAHKWPDLLAPIRARLASQSAPWVIENVVGAPLRVDILLCGSQFGLGMIRHRVFELSWEFPFGLLPPCDHGGMYDPWHREGTDQLRQMGKAMGIDWMGRRDEVREAIPPAYTQFIGEQLLQHIGATKVTT